MADPAHPAGEGDRSPRSHIESIREELEDISPFRDHISLGSPNMSPTQEKPRNGLHDASFNGVLKEKHKEQEMDDEDEISEERDAVEYTEEEGDLTAEEDGGDVRRTISQAREIWKFRLRPADDDEDETWWFASTAIPLLAATTGPLANVLSIAALVTSWRMRYDPDNPDIDDDGIPYNDPDWCIHLNIASLVCGFVGNLFLLFNFTRRVRYIIALPMTIVIWYVATGILIGITVHMNQTVPPIPPNEIYSQGYWHAVFAAALYLISSMLLMVNMLGYFLGHYTQHFELTEEQQNLILQTMMFFIWLAGGAGLFSRIAGWDYPDALYFCDVTLLTVGFGDFSAPNDLSRALLFPYSVGGIIILGLMVSSLNKFAIELGQDKVVRNHVESRRVRTQERAVSSSFEATRREMLENQLLHAKTNKSQRPSISAPFNPEKRTITFNGDLVDEDDKTEGSGNRKENETIKETEADQPKTGPLRRTATLLGLAVEPIVKTASLVSRRGNNRRRRRSRAQRLIILREERDRFNAMRAIQDETRRFKRWFSLAISVTAFALLQCVGALAFFYAEKESQGLSYFEALYFCYVSLLTIGYGDLSPKSNVGKPLFIVWSLIAVPTMTILISNLGDTVVASYKRGTFTLADWTVLPRKGLVHDFLEQHPKFMAIAKHWTEKRAAHKRLIQGFQVGPDNDPEAQNELENEKSRSQDDFLARAPSMTLEQLADEHLDEHDLAKRLAVAIRRTADHLKHGHDARYSYEEWVEYTRLIRFSNYTAEEESEEEEPSSSQRKKPSSAQSRLSKTEDVDGIIEWDWIGSDSPMMSGLTEAEWILDRLCESLDRYMEHQLPSHVKARQKEKKQRRRDSLTAENAARGVGSTPSTAAGAAFSPMFAKNGIQPDSFFPPPPPPPPPPPGPQSPNSERFDGGRGGRGLFRKRKTHRAAPGSGSDSGGDAVVNNDAPATAAAAAAAAGGVSAAGTGGSVRSGTPSQSRSPAAARRRRRSSGLSGDLGGEVARPSQQSGRGRSGSWHRRWSIAPMPTPPLASATAPAQAPMASSSAGPQSPRRTGTGTGTETEKET